MLYDWGYIKAHQNKLYKCTYTDSINMFYKLSFEYQINNRNSTSYTYMDSLF